LLQNGANIKDKVRNGNKNERERKITGINEKKHEFSRNDCPFVLLFLPFVVQFF
jgi:hypothetical protein